MTAPVKLTTEWVQLTTGSESKVIQAVNGMAYIATSTTKPDASAVGVSISGSDKMTIAPPAVTWVRGGKGGGLLAVLQW